MLFNTILKKVRLLLFPAILVLSSCASGPIGRPEAQAMSWEFIQSVGGIELGNPYTTGGRHFVPLIVDVSGSKAITVAPTLTNTRLVCSMAAAVGGGNFLRRNVWVTIYTEPEPIATTRGGGPTSTCNDILLSPGLLFGSIAYNIYYIEKRVMVVDFNSRKNLIGVVR